MLTKNQEEYLQKIPKDKITKIDKWDPKIPEIAEELIKNIKSVEPDLPVLFMGASALGIAGQNDIDLYISSPVSEFEKHLLNLKKVFGENISGISVIKWETKRENHDVEIYLTDSETPSMKEQIAVFEILKNNTKLRQEYEKIKIENNGQSFREYMKRKYEFFNRILRV